MKIKVIIDTGNLFNGNGTYEIPFEVGETFANLKSKIEDGGTKLSASLQNDEREVLSFCTLGDGAALCGNVPVLWDSVAKSWTDTAIPLNTVLGPEHNGSVVYALLSLSMKPIDDYAPFDPPPDAPPLNPKTAVAAVRDRDKPKEKSEELTRYLTGVAIGALAIPFLYYGCASTAIGSNFLGSFSPRVAMGCMLLGAILGYGAAYELDK